MDWDFSQYTKQPSPEPYEEILVAPLVEQEAKRQFESFYPVIDDEKTKRALLVIENGIWNAMKRGLARAKNGCIEWWHHMECIWVPYDHEYNDYMMEFYRYYQNRKMMMQGEIYTGKMQ